MLDKLTFELEEAVTDQQKKLDQETSAALKILKEHMRNLKTPEKLKLAAEVVAIMEGARNSIYLELSKLDSPLKSKRHENQTEPEPEPQTKGEDPETDSPEAVVIKLNILLTKIEKTHITNKGAASAYAYNGLCNKGIDTIGDLIQCTEKDLLYMKNFGRKSLKEIKEMLATKSLGLGTVLTHKCKRDFEAAKAMNLK